MKSQIHASKQTVTILLLTCLCSTALAQNYGIEYESPPGFRLALAIEPFETDRLDFNGDGTAIPSAPCPQLYPQAVQIASRND